MDDARFQALVGAYGGDQARWPDAERAKALRHLAATPDAHRARTEARALDAALAAWATAGPSEALRARIARGQPRGRPPGSRTVWLSAAGLIAAGIVGVMVGADIGHASLSTTPATTSSDSDAEVSAALDSTNAFSPNADGTLS